MRNTEGQKINEISNLLQKTDKVVATQRNNLQKKKPTMGKRARQIAIAGIFLLTVACAGSIATPTTEAVNPVISPPTDIVQIQTDEPVKTVEKISPLTGEELTLLSGPEAVADTFPQVFGLSQFERFEMKINTTNDRLILRNYTEHSMDTNAVVDIYESIEKLNFNSAFIDGVMFEFMGNIYGVTVKKYTLDRGKIMTVTPDHIGNSGITFLNYQAGSNSSFIKTNVEDILLTNKSFAVEVCQSGFNFDAKQISGSTVLSESELISLDNHAQEFACNSIDTAVGLKAAGYNYARYNEFVETYGMWSTSNSPPEKRAKVTEEQYNSVTAVNSIFK